MMRLCLTLMGASAALAVRPRVNPTSSASSIDPTPVYSTTATVKTTYIPTALGDYGAISTHKVTSTRHFDPTTFQADPSAGCAGGVIVFTAEGEYTTPLSIGMWIAKVARIAGTSPSDYVVYEAVFDAKLTETTITALVCNKAAFDATMESMIKAPNLWNMGVGTLCSNFMTSAGASRRVCTYCFDGEYLLAATGNCYPCTPIDGCTGLLTCSNASNSVCTNGPCDATTPVPIIQYCKPDEVECDLTTGTFKCRLEGCDTYAYRTVDGLCELCDATGVTNCKPQGNICADLTGGNPTCGANECNLGYQNGNNAGPCEPCSALANCPADQIICTELNDPNASCAVTRNAPRKN